MPFGKKPNRMQKVFEFKVKPPLGHSFFSKSVKNLLLNYIDCRYMIKDDPKDFYLSFRY